MPVSSERQPVGPLIGDLTKILVGREEETERLDKVVAESEGGVSFVVVRGCAGAGKSAFVRSYPWDQKGWILATGKFEENRMKEPYSAIVDALDDLIVQWVDNDCKQQVSQLGALGMLLDNDFELLKDVLPARFFEAVGLELNKEERSAPSPSTETFVAGAVNAAFRRVITFLCKSQQVALFLEDVHWVDQSSLDIVKALVSSGKNVDGLLLIVTHRSDEVREGHIFKTCLENIHGQKEAVVHTIDILDLDVANVNKLLTGLLQTDPKDARWLAEAVHRKTAGNPFFVVQFLQLIREEMSLAFCYASQKWEWCDVDKLDMLAEVSDNVADVVATTIKRLPDETQMALKAASCLGKTILLDVLEDFFVNFPDDKSWDFSAFDCVDTIQAVGLVAVLDIAVQSGILTRPSNGSTYMWSHDRLQNVVYSLIPKANLSSLHINLGKLLWRKSYYKNSAKNMMVFMAADQLSRVPIKECNKRLGIVATHLHFGAGKLSMAKSALLPALEFLKTGVKTLEHRSGRWREHYDLSLELYSCLAEVAAHLGSREEAMAAIEEIDKHSRCLDDKFRSQLMMLKVVTSGDNRDYNLAVEKTLGLLKLYGEKLPTRLLPGQLFLENQKLRLRLPGGRLEGLIELPFMSNDQAHKVTTILTRHLRLYAHFSKTQKQAATLSSIRALNIACKMGVCSDTVMAVGWMAADLKLERHYYESCEYAQLAVRLIKKFPQKLGSLHAFVLILVNGEILPAIRPFHDCLEPLLECHEIGLKTGENDPAMGAILVYTFSYLSIGFPLAPLSSNLTAYMQKAAQLCLPYPFQLLFKIFGQAVLNLVQGSRSPTVLNGEIMNQEEELSKVAGRAATMTMRDINTFRLMLACVYNEWGTASTLLDFLESYLGFEGVISRAHFRIVYIGLAAFVVGRKSGMKRYLALANKVLKSFKAERKLGYINAVPIVAMLQAEALPSKEGYQKAIKVCTELRLVQHEAFMCERFSLYCKEHNDSSSAKVYLLRAFAAYRDWGAIGKLDAMRKEHGVVLESLAGELKAGHPALVDRGQCEAKASTVLAKLAWQNLSEGGNCDGLSIDTSRASMSTVSSQSD